MDVPARPGAWPPGGGGMARLIRAHDWAATPLGPAEGWPERLRAAVELLLADPRPASLTVGPDRTFLFNEAAARLYGPRAPDLLGLPLPQAFPSYPEVAELYDRAFAGEPGEVRATPLAVTDEGGEAFDATLLPVGDGAGGVLAVLVTGVEVGAALRAEAGLRASERRLRGALDSMAEGFALFDRDFVIRDVNDETLRLDGRTRGELVGRSHWEAFPGTERSALGDLYRRAMRDREPGWMEHRHAWPDGRVMWVEVRAHPTADGGVACFWRDVSDRKKGDAARREGEARHRLLQAAWEADAGGVVVADSPSWRAYTGQTLDEWLGHGWLGAVHPEDRAHAERQWREAIAARGLVDAEFRLRAPDGGWRWTNVRAAPVLDAGGRVEKWAGMTIDIDARKRAEAALRASEERQAFLLALSDAFAPLATPAEVAAVAAARLRERLDADRVLHGEIEGDILRVERDCVRGVPSIVGEHPLASFGPGFFKAYRAGAVIRVDDVGADPRLTPAARAELGERRVAAFVDVVLFEEGGGVSLLAVQSATSRAWTPGEEGLIREVAERVRSAIRRARAEGALRESEERLRMLTEGIPQLVWTAVDGGHWTWSSPQWSAFTSLSEAQSRGQGWLEALHPDDRAAAMAAWDVAVERGAFEAEYRLREAATGEHRWFQTRATPSRDEAGAVLEWLGTSTDVQALKELQARQGVLVAELQHRTRNLMGVVRAITDRTLRDSESPEAFAATLQDRLDALARVQGLLSRLHEGDRLAFDELIRTELSALGVLNRAGRGSPRVALEGPEGVRLRSGTVQTLALALHELATNAVKHGAFAQGGGRLTVRWRLVGDGEAPRLRVEWIERGVDMGRAPAEPPGSGYGRELIERALPYQLQARTIYALEPQGVRCVIELPVSQRVPGEGNHA